MGLSPRVALYSPAVSVFCFHSVFLAVEALPWPVPNRYPPPRDQRLVTKRKGARGEKIIARKLERPPGAVSGAGSAKPRPNERTKGKRKALAATQRLAAMWVPAADESRRGDTATGDQNSDTHSRDRGDNGPGEGDGAGGDDGDAGGDGAGGDNSGGASADAVSASPPSPPCADAWRLSPSQRD